MAYRRFGLRSDHRRSMLRNMVSSLIKEEKITTTETRAKDISKILDKMVTLGKKGDLHSRRLAAAYLVDDDSLKKLFGDVAERFEDRQGGYSRVIKTGYRKGDGAPMAVIELLK